MAQGDRVVVESPFAGDTKRNIRYARACIKDCFNRGEYPFASHILYTQEGILNDEIAEERKLGIEGNLVWSKVASITVVYTDLGISEGMKAGIKEAEKEGRKIEYRSLDGKFKLS